MLNVIHSITHFFFKFKDLKKRIHLIQLSHKESMDDTIALCLLDTRNIIIKEPLKMDYLSPFLVVHSDG